MYIISIAVQSFGYFWESVTPWGVRAGEGGGSVIVLRVQTGGEDELETTSRNGGGEKIILFSSLSWTAGWLVSGAVSLSDCWG